MQHHHSGPWRSCLIALTASQPLGKSPVHLSQLWVLQTQCPALPQQLLEVYSADEIEQWIIDEFKKAGLDTAKSILEIDKTELIKRTDLEEETIQEVLAILKAEFEE